MWKFAYYKEDSYNSLLQWCKKQFFETAGELLYREKLNNKGCDVPVPLKMSDHNEIWPPALNTPCTQLLFLGSAVCALLFFIVL